jgi:hypothetical protein
MQPTFKIKLGGQVAQQLENMGVPMGSPDYINHSAEHWTRWAPYNPARLTERAKRLLAMPSTEHDILYLPETANLTANQMRCFGTDAATARATPLPHVNSVADAFDCTDHLNQMAEKAVLR